MSVPSSVIITTRNRARSLRRALGALARQTKSPGLFEIIVVDDGSEDETSTLCASMSREMRNLKYVSPGKHIGLARAANLGIETAQGDYLLFTDDDCVPREDWLERMCAALQREPIVAGAVESRRSNYIRLCHNVAQFYQFMPGRKAGPIEFAAGANMGLRRAVVRELSGFREMDIALDTELALRARARGYRIYFVPDAVVIHHPNRTDLPTIVRYSACHAAQTILLRNKYRALLRTPFVLRSPFLTLLAAPVIAMKVTAEAYARNVNLAKMFWTAPTFYALKLAWCWGAAHSLKKHRRATTHQ